MFSLFHKDNSARSEAKPDDQTPAGVERAGAASFAGVRQAPLAMGAPPRREAEAMGCPAGAGDGDLAGKWPGRCECGGARECCLSRDGTGRGEPPAGGFGAAATCGARGSAASRCEPCVGGRRERRVPAGG